MGRVSEKGQRGHQPQRVGAPADVRPPMPMTRSVGPGERPPFVLRWNFNVVPVLTGRKAKTGPRPWSALRSLNVHVLGVICLGGIRTDGALRHSLHNSRPARSVCVCVCVARVGVPCAPCRKMRESARWMRKSLHTPVESARTRSHTHIQVCTDTHTHHTAASTYLRPPTCTSRHAPSRFAVQRQPSSDEPTGRRAEDPTATRRGCGPLFWRAQQARGERRSDSLAVGYIREDVPSLRRAIGRDDGDGPAMPTLCPARHCGKLHDDAHEHKQRVLQTDRTYRDAFPRNGRAGERRRRGPSALTSVATIAPM